MKDFFVLPVPASTLYKISLEGGGEVPDVLKGNFTSPALAKREIQSYLSNTNPEALEKEIRVADVNKTVPKKKIFPSLNEE